ncbi:hypothetical protein [Chromobacterium piscinae]|uniref:hypothetical protein n=1 Tax=Chromobacterium piscinae TaxID=686831 RepID=UPI001C8BA8D9|nr:hypothetical protein [Chromobacterium vaccinii]
MSGPKGVLPKAAIAAVLLGVCSALGACKLNEQVRRDSINQEAAELSRKLPDAGSQFWAYYGLTVIQQRLTLAANGYYAWESVSDDSGAPPPDRDYGRWREEKGQLVLVSQFDRGEKRLQAGCRDGEFVWLYGYADEEPAWHGNGEHSCAEIQLPAKSNR